MKKINEKTSPFEHLRRCRRCNNLFYTPAKTGKFCEECKIRTMWKNGKVVRIKK